jgi:hypothetical protein
MKVRDREIRQTLMNSIVEFKQKIAQVMEVMRADTQSNISNVLIAQLNDVAYKAIRKKGVQKKLDERAIKNEGLYKKLDGQLKGIIKKLDIPKLKEEHKALIDAVGSCPMSQNDTVEAMGNGDCMCICLQISRSEATI